MDDQGQQIIKPKCLPARLDKITEKDAYIMDNGEYINLFISTQAPTDFIYEVFN